MADDEMVTAEAAEQENTRKLDLISKVTGLTADELLDALDTYAESRPAAEPELADGGYWAEIAFLGRIEYTGYVTQVTKHGQAAYHIDLPEKLWGGNPLGWVEHAASAWFSERPVTEASVRGQWESAVKAAAARARREAEWQRMQEQRAIEAGTAGGDDEQGGPAF